MLGTLLPGVRHVRTPLVTGSLYLLVLWMLFGPVSLSTDGDTTAERNLAAAADLVGRTGVVATLGLVALLLGSLLVIQQLPQRPWRRHLIDMDGINAPLYEISWGFDMWVSDRAHSLSNVHWGDLLDPKKFDERFRSRVSSVFDRRYGDPEGYDERHRADWEDRQDGHETQPASLRNIEDAKNEVVKDYLLAQVASWAIAGEFGLLAARLRIDHENLFNEVDRLRSEAELRYSIVPPLVMLVAVLAFQWHWAAVFAVVAPVALTWHAYRSEREARRRVAEALQFGVIKSPTLERLVEIQRD